jgi:hypothetical protein
MNPEIPTRYGPIDLRLSRAVMRTIERHAKPVVAALDEAHVRSGASREELPSRNWARLLGELFPGMSVPWAVGSSDELSAETLALLPPHARVAARKLLLAVASWLLARHTTLEEREGISVEVAVRGAGALLDLVEQDVSRT